MKGNISSLATFLHGRVSSKSLLNAGPDFTAWYRSVDIGCIFQLVAIPETLSFLFCFSMMVRGGNGNWSSAKPKHINNPNHEYRSPLDVNSSSHDWFLVHTKFLRTV